MGASRFIATAALANLALYHWPLLGFAASHLDSTSWNGVQTLLTLAILAFFATALGLGLLALLSVRLLKPFAMLAAIGNSIAVYYVATYAVVLDISMMGNVLNTHAAEAVELLSGRLFLYVLVLGIVPAALLWQVRIGSDSRWRLLRNGALLLVSVLAWSWSAAGTSLWIDKHAKRLGGMVMPWSYSINGLRHQAAQRQSPEPVLLPPATLSSPGKALVLLVIGEAARAQDFSLYGYARPTNPQLTAAGAVALADTVACSTYTTAALRCILSHTQPGSAFSENWEPLPSYLQRHGVDVIWRSNNWGEPPLVVQDYQKAGELRPDCLGDGCAHDEVLLTGLAQRIRHSSRDKVLVVLHQSGSHGPAYFSKYPPAFEVFRPVCRSVELNRCTPQELLNAYDNTILYTDQVLAQVIGLLKDFDDRPAALLYISDHGESLGEFGLYLHGTPWAIAPDVQKQIPLIAWLSAEFRQARGLPAAGLPQAATHSQGNVFHSVLGALGIDSPVYDADLDIFKPTTQSQTDAKP